MPSLSKAEAARRLGISRTTLYKLIHAGKLSVTPDGMIDPTELVRDILTLQQLGWPRRTTEQDWVAREQIAPRINALLDMHVSLLERCYELVPITLRMTEEFLRKRSPDAEYMLPSTGKDVVIEVKAQARAEARRLLQGSFRGQTHIHPGKDLDIEITLSKSEFLLAQANQSLDLALGRLKVFMNPVLQEDVSTAPDIPKLPVFAVARRHRLPVLWQRILAWMQAYPGPQHWRQVQAGLGETDRIRHTMKRLAAASVLCRTGRGMYETLAHA